MIWAKHGRIWYPAQICSFNYVPSNLPHWFSVQNEKVLGENLVDAAKSTFIMGQYNIALEKRLSYTYKNAVMKTLTKKENL